MSANDSNRLHQSGVVVTPASEARTVRRGTRADVVVIGAGGAGISCAIEAAERGALVTVIDAAPGVGGTASVAGGGTTMGGSPLQEQLGIEDSFDLALEDWLTWGGDTVDVEWAERYLRAAQTDLFDRLADLGVRWVDVSLQEGNRVPRWHKPAGGGKAVMAALERKARALPGITWLFEHRVQELVLTGGQVSGVIARNASGDVEISAGAVVVASGGFNNSTALVREHAVHAAHAERILLGGGLGALGEGHRMLETVGAQFTQLDVVWMLPYGTPDPRDPSGQRGLAVRGLKGEVWVNDDGLRFHDESLRGGATGMPALLQQPKARSWSVFDARLASKMTIADPYFREGGEPLRDRITEFLGTSSPHVKTARTLAELADQVGVDAGNLQESVAQNNAAIAAGLERDPEFGKPLIGLKPIEEGPFVAVRLYPIARKNLGGVRTDHDCRVLDTEDQPIVGLYAAGEVAGMAGGRINGRAALEGTMFGPSMFSGMVAGRAVAG